MFDTADFSVEKKKKIWMLQRMSVSFLGQSFCTFKRYCIARQAAVLTGDVTACERSVSVLFLF